MVLAKFKYGTNLRGLKPPLSYTHCIYKRITTKTKCNKKCARCWKNMSVEDKGTRRKENGNVVEEQNWKLIPVSSFCKKEDVRARRKRKKSSIYM
jgi:hypothetical protein